MIVNCNPLLSQSEEELTLKIIANGDALCGTEWKATVFTPPYTRLYYIAAGEAEIETAAGHLELQTGMLYLLPAGYPFSHQCRTSMRQLFFHINLVNAEGFDLLRGIHAVLQLKVEEDEIRELLQLHASGSMTDQLYLRALLKKDIFTILHRAGIELTTANYSDCVKKAIDFIESHLSASLTVQEVADRIYVSPNTLAHKFKQEMGVSVGSYIDELVLFRAEQLLLNTDLSLSQISDSLCFYDQFYFSKRFKARFLVPPLQYRKACRSAK